MTFREMWQQLRVRICILLVPSLKWFANLQVPITGDPSWVFNALAKPPLFNGDHIGALMYGKLQKWWNDPLNGSIRLQRHYSDLLQLSKTDVRIASDAKRLETAFKELEVCYLWSIERETMVDRIVRMRAQLELNPFDDGDEDDDHVNLLPRLMQQESELRGLDSTYLGLLLDNRHYMTEFGRVSVKELEADQPRPESDF